MKIAALQTVSGTGLEANLDRAHALLAEAARAGAELAVLPEYFGLMGRRDTDKLAIQEPFGRGAIQDFLAAAARDLGLWIVGGTLPITVVRQPSPPVTVKTLPSVVSRSRAYPAPAVAAPAPAVDPAADEA